LEKGKKEKRSQTRNIFGREPSHKQKHYMLYSANEGRNKKESWQWLRKEHERRNQKK
jgi:hypothetical protein